MVALGIVDCSRWGIVKLDVLGLHSNIDPGASDLAKLRSWDPAITAAHVVEFGAMTEGTNSFAMKWVFYGSAPENVRQLIDDQIDFSFNDGGRFSPVLLEAIQWNSHSDFKYDYELGYWDNGVCALFERIGGIDALASLVKEANPLRRTLHITRRATETDIVDGPGPFSQDSEYFTINLSEKTLSQISELGLDLFITYRVPR